MLAQLGSVLTSFALITAVFAVFAILYGTLRLDARWFTNGRRALYASTGLLLGALGLLVMAFITDQFQIQYVALHSSVSLPLHLKLSALWAGQEGSLMLWAFLQVLFAALIARGAKPEHEPLSAWASVILGVIAVFFIAMTLFFSNPFITSASTPLDGQGMNPLLRHPGMIFHPPALYIGYVGLAVPFAFALASLIVGKVDQWPKVARSWLLMAWVALGLGIFLGMRWAYDVLGWGGYWGWDPVENAGLMPWLTATALLHGLTMQERGKGFKVWNISLAAISFALVLFGAFTTRSGLITSVHAFSRSQLGPYFLGMIGLTLIGTLAVMIVRRKAFGELVYPEKLISREGAFFFTLLLLVLITLSILTGTLLPTLTNGRFTASPAWFNRVVGPQLGALVLLMGVCPLLGRLTVSIKSSLWRGLPPLLGALLMTLFAILSGYTRPLAITSLVIAGFAGGAAIGDSAFDLSRRLKRRSALQLQSRIPVTGRHGYGGQLVHLGVVLMAVGVIGTQMYATSENLTLMPGESAKVGAYTLTYEDIFQEAAEDHLETRVSISVYRESAFLTTLEPRMNYYPSYQQTIAEPAIRAGMGEDLYLVLFQWDVSGTADLSVMINPLSGFLWVGGFVLLVGGVLAWWPRFRLTDSEGKQKRRLHSQIGAAVGLLVILVLAVTLWGNSFSSSGQSGRPLPGKAAPEISAVDITGQDFTLSAYEGQIVVVNFWATWCPQCEEELPAFEDVWQEYQDQGVQFVGVAMDDDLEAVKAMASALGIHFPLIVEENGQITSAYGVTAVPETFVIGPDGSVTHFHIGVIDADVLREELQSLVIED